MFKVLKSSAKSIYKILKIDNLSISISNSYKTLFQASKGNKIIINFLVTKKIKQVDKI